MYFIREGKIIQTAKETFPALHRATSWESNKMIKGETTTRWLPKDPLYEQNLLLS